MKTLPTLHFIGENDAVECVRNSSQFAEWFARLDPRFTVHQIEVHAVTQRRNGQLLFALITATVTDADDLPVPGTLLLRGDAVAILIVVHQDDARYVVLIEQQRFPGGLYASCEIPAGMQEPGELLSDVAMREIAEETGIRVPAAALVALGAFYASSGGSDECITLYSCDISLSDEDCARLIAQERGASEDHERISVRLVPLDQLPAVTQDPKALIAYLRYKELPVPHPPVACSVD